MDGITKNTNGVSCINLHHQTMTDVLNCNTNVKIGDASQVYYSTLYTGKSTQEEDIEQQQRVVSATIQMLL